MNKADELRAVKNVAEAEMIEAGKQLSEAQKRYCNAKKKLHRALDAWIAEVEKTDGN